ncbi:ASKHA domain-containing protein [Pelotomaculum terephthalicicum JT]|uniref:ASKHA domain-containing protein n=1 Tax=Pelotomaculum terephthalicicum TaxID=206393 RepID=UPI0009C64BCC|nr:ASKHA domain-containing protein [Pelotomaculum terephthalicicum]MCG9968607.1 ASKHA domain-containing protein [Pelotomaculum terephthalicicum JT]OPX84986.1 MAG: hypothetical protein A4E54_02716 [Pelotomaculum sp. PtaB.Bin117]
MRGEIYWEFFWEALIQEKNLSAEITADYCVLRKIALTGIIAKSGRFNKHLPSRRLRKNESGKTEFVLAWARETAIDQDIVLTQGDVRAVQLAKAALYTGARYLVEKLDQMTAAERLQALAKGEAIDRLPCVPIVGNGACG